MYGLPEFSEPVQVKIPQRNPEDNTKVDKVIAPAINTEAGNDITITIQANPIKHDTKSPIPVVYKNDAAVKALDVIRRNLPTFNSGAKSIRDTAKSFPRFF